MTWLKDRAAYVVALAASATSLVSAFGVELTAEQTAAITTFVATLVSLVLGRKVTPSGKV